MYMAMKHLETIVEKLVSAGRRPDEGAAIVCNATTVDQQVVVSNLANIAAESASAGLKPPALFIVGDVVRLRDGLDWLGASKGERTLVADPLEQE